MTFAERVAALVPLGFSARQATFVATVLLHGGVCVPRQYCTHAGICHGAVSRQFFDRLVRKGFATPYPEKRQGRTSVYHLSHRPLYRAIGHPNSPHRRPPNTGRAVERLLLLDGIVAAQPHNCLATSADKIHFFTETLGVPRTALPQRRYLPSSGALSATVRHFPDNLPIDVSDQQRPVFLVPVTDPTVRQFSAWIDGHFSLLVALTQWTIRLVVSPTFRNALPAHRRVFDERFGTVLAPAEVDLLLRFFHTRRALETVGGPTPSSADMAFYQRHRSAFGAPRHFRLYRAWLRDPDAVHRSADGRLPDAFQEGRVGLDALLALHAYDRLGAAPGSA